MLCSIGAWPLTEMLTTPCIAPASIGARDGTWSWESPLPTSAFAAVNRQPAIAANAPAATHPLTARIADRIAIPIKFL
jgi:hypothetical protein